MPSSPKVSVVIPVLNGGRYLRACLDSLICQTYRDFETIVVDNGSTDNSVEIARSYQQNGVRVVDGSEKTGVSAARNLGISEARGEWITFVDADDTVCPNFLEEGVGALQQNNLDWIMGGVVKVFDDAHIDYYSKKVKRDLVCFEDGAIGKIIDLTVGYRVPGEDFLNSFYGPPVWARIMKTSLARNTLFNEALSIGEDTVFNVRVLQRCRKCGVFSKPWYQYRVHPDSTVRTYGLEWEDRIRLMLDELESLLESNEEQVRYVKVRSIEQLKALIVNAYKGNPELCTALLDDPYWMRAADGLSFFDPVLSNRSKLLTLAINSRSRSIKKLATKAVCHL